VSSQISSHCFHEALLGCNTTDSQTFRWKYGQPPITECNKRLWVCLLWIFQLPMNAISHLSYVASIFHDLISHPLISGGVEGQKAFDLMLGFEEVTNVVMTVPLRLLCNRGRGCLRTYQTTVNFASGPVCHSNVIQRRSICTWNSLCISVIALRLFFAALLLKCFEYNRQ